MGTIYSMSTRAVNGVDRLGDVGDDDQRPQHDGDKLHDDATEAQMSASTVHDVGEHGLGQLCQVDDKLHGHTQRTAQARRRALCGQVQAWNVVRAKRKRTRGAHVARASTSARCAQDMYCCDRDALRRCAAARPRTPKPARSSDVAQR